MSIQTWPLGLPTALAFGARVKPQSNKVSFQPAVGPAIERRRATLALRHHEVSIKMTEAEAAAFLDFYEDVLKDGTLPFTGLRDPFGVARAFRITGEPDLGELSRGLWAVTLKLEEQPA